MIQEKTPLLSDERISRFPYHDIETGELVAIEQMSPYHVRDVYEADRASLLSVVRELATALAYATEGMNCDDWGEVDLNGEGATAPYAHDIVAMPGGCPKCKANDLLSKIKSTYNIEP